MSNLTRTMLVDSLDATAQDAFDLARRHIDALGGSCKPSNRYGEGYNDAIGHALEIMDRFGALDPAMRVALRRKALEQALMESAKIALDLEG